MSVYVCELCDGAGWVNNTRCPCREEDDEARERRLRMGIVRSDAGRQDDGDVRRLPAPA
jgi:hypothetical protein